MTTDLFEHAARREEVIDEALTRVMTGNNGEFAARLPEEPGFDDAVQAALLKQSEKSAPDKWFEDWRHSPNGREVTNKFIRVAVGLKRSGFKTFGAKAIAERVRWHMTIKAGPDGESFKMNNNAVSRLARFAEQRAPELKGFFIKRRLKA